MAEGIMDQATMGWYGGMAGGAIGVMGGLLGTAVSIINARSPAERSFVIRAAVVVWACMVAFLLGLWLLPTPYRFLMWIPYSILLPLGIRYGNRRQEEIRRGETTEA
jgi:hypothetical protein